MTDPAVVIASLGEVDRAKNEAKDYADKIINELDINIQQAITEAVKTAVRDARRKIIHQAPPAFLTRTSTLMSAGRGRNGFTPVKIKQSGWQKLTAQT